MTLNQLDYFLAIAETGSITKAAASLNMSQPPLSLQLMTLEKELGVQLFKREKKQLTITEKGLLLQIRAWEIINLVNSTILEIQSHSGTPRALIRIGTIGSVCNRILPAKIMAFKSRFPHMAFELHENSSTSILELLRDGVVDIGVVREPFNASLYHTILIKDTVLDSAETDSFMTIAVKEFYEDPDSPVVELSSLKDKPLIIHRRYTNLVTASCWKRGFVPKIICQNDNISSSLSWAASGIGIAIAPYTSAIQNTDPALLLKRIENPTIISRAYLIWNKNADLTEEEEAFISMFN